MTQINQNQKKKTPDTSELVKKLGFNAKIVEIENKIPSVSGLAADAALTAVENKIPNVSNLVKKKNQIIIQKLMKLKRNLLIMNMINILLPQNLVIQQQGFLQHN